MMNSILLFMFAVVFVIAVGYLFKLNIGLVAIIVAYALSIFYGISAAELIALWPTKLFLTILSVSLFYGFASMNGAIEKLALKIVFLFRKAPAAIPAVLFLVTGLIAGSGGGPYVSTVVMAPIIIGICRTTNLKPLLGVLALTFGGSFGGLSGTSIVGLLVKSLIEKTDFAPLADALQHQIFLNATVFYFIAFAFFYLVFGGYRIKATALECPEPFTLQPPRSLVTILAMIVLYVMPTLLLMVFPGSAFISAVKNKADFIFFAIAGSVICFLLKLGGEREIFQRVSWSTLVMISGMATLVGIGETVGIIQQISELVTTHVMSSRIPQIMAVAAGVLSYVSDGLAVVYPTLYPLVAKICTLTGLDPGLLFTAISLGDSATVASPFSTGGALMLSFILNDKERTKLFTQLMIIPFGTLAVLLIVLTLGILG
jgi:di/tricarboxylate transporter